MWKPRVTKLLELNLATLRRIFMEMYIEIAQHTENEKEHITLAQVHKLSENAGFNLTKLQVINAYTNSKSTLVNETCPLGRENYTKMNFGEFLELVCRLTLFRFSQSEMSHFDLYDKLRFSLEVLFARINTQVEILEEKFVSPLSAQIAELVSDSE